MKKLAFVLLLGFGAEGLAEESTPKPPNVLDTFYPDLDDGCNLWLRADLLYFFPEEDSIAMTNKQTDLFTTADVTQKDVVDPNFHWDPGYRLGFGYVFRNSCWDMALLWTHFNTDIHQHRSNHGDIGKGMFPIWSLSDDILPYDWVANAKMKWKLRLNLLDLDFGRSFAWKKTFFLRPYIGLRSTWIDQDIDVQYGGGIFANGLNLPALDSTFGTDTIDMDNDFWGIGPIVGLEPQINLGKGFRIYGAASGAVNYGYFDVDQKETYLTTTRFHLDRQLNRFSWIFDAAAGIMWKTFLKEERYALTFGVGWEYHIFFDQVKLKKDEFGLVSHNRDLTLNGIDVSLQFDF
jgi:hypothetical protein